MAVSLLPDNPAAWTYHSWEDLMAIPREEREKLQLEAVRINFARLRNRIPAPKKLADRQGVETIDKIEDVLPVCFDHRVLKNYPIQIIENRDFAKLTGWLDQLTAHDLSKVDPWKTKLPTFFPGYRGGHQTMLKMMSLFNVETAGGEEHYFTLYDTHIPADLMALSGRMQAAEDKGEIASLGLDPALLEQRRTMLDQGRRKEEDLEVWFGKLIEQFKGQRVKLGGTFADLYRVARAGLDKGLRCEFAPGSILQAAAA
ncbi:MAG: hypothetical protein ABIQ81_07995 [Novosphingobium sp.]